jgi:putative (di)nucleoside polyphosphate hydrolase
MSREHDMRDKRDQRNEPTLDELLADPITWTVMKSDKVEEHELRNLLKRVAAELAAGSAPDEESERLAQHDGAFRKGVGIMLLNERNEVFVGQRADTQRDAWQMPQGGIDGEENPREAALRELKEEIGTDKAHIIAESKNWLRYELPPELPERWGDRSRWRGQQQKWFVMRFHGTDADINVATEHPEFSAWKWVSIQQLPDLIVSFKRQLYLDVVREFSQFGSP